MKRVDHRIGDQRVEGIPVPPGSMDRGPVEFDSRVARRQGEILSIASTEVVTAPPTTTIIGAIKIMNSYGFRRLPIADAGTNRLLGFVTCVDIVDFLGGGIRHNLVRKKYEGNILAAINAEIREIMSSKVISAPDTASVDDALKIMYERNVGGLPIVDERSRIKAIVTEEDFVEVVRNTDIDTTVSDYMSPNVVTAPASMSIEKTSRMIVQKGFRRLPIIQDGILTGIITASDIMKYMASGEAFSKIITGDIREVMEQPIKSLIKRSLIMTDPRTRLKDAANLMVEKDVGSLPVMEGGSMVGIITERDFLRALAEHRGVAR
ncbi:MAG: CBS domain-containing protein [Methanothrix sp.]|jgi:Predicted transcriptional regulator, contains C-terminal CBS domains|uniref:CBS domain-containing protein n=1 Tax=Methanothrix sp. TaxID=90426 RepID=UPI0019B89606|nr:CBS domain-containing protein [Methanothrix sp.]MBC7080148.1 CBS domain-containing protein [Methanothrix sp.]NPU87874.1 CBS domain-containing protein [Methanothrix sp.]